MTFSLRGLAWTAFAVAVLLLVGNTILLFRATQRFSASEAMVGHTREVEAVLESLGSEVFHASNSAQAFVLTGDKALLDAYKAGILNINSDLLHLRQLTSDNPERKRQLDDLETNIRSALEITGGFIDAHRKGTASIDADAQMANQTAEIQRRVETLLEQLREDETRVLIGRQEIARSSYGHTLRMITLSFLVALMLFGIQTFLLSYSFSQYRHTQNIARQSREIVDAFFASSTVGFGILDSQLRYTRVNEILPRMAGLRPEDMLGKSMPEIFGPRGARTEGVLREVLRTGTPLLDREISAELPNHPGEMRHWLVNYFPMRGETVAYAQIGIIAVDVTARRNAEDALRKLSGRLLGIQDQERRRIARELHDSLGQYLAGLKIAIELLSNSPMARDHSSLLAECSDILQKALTETRTLSHLLHPPLLDEAGFASAASWFVTGFSQRSGIPVSLDMPEDLPRLSEAVEIALFRVLQESLTNVHRHSQTPSAEIKVEADAEQISIEVADHGKGMPRHVLEQIAGEGKGTKLGVGLAGMRERVRELGGIFEVTSDRGTTIRATVPLSVRHEAEPARAGSERSS